MGEQVYTAVYAGVTTAATGRVIGVEEGNGSFKEGRKEGWSCQQELLEFGSPTQCKMISTDVGVHIYRHTNIWININRYIYMYLYMYTCI